MKRDWNKCLYFDEPRIELPWTASPDVIAATCPESHHQDGPFYTFLGTSGLHWRAADALRLCYLSGPIQALRTPMPAYDTMAAALCAEFGEPNRRDIFSFPAMFPDHQRLTWRLGEREMRLYMDDVHWNSYERLELCFVAHSRLQPHAS